jgi:hypothetical protein
MVVRFFGTCLRQLTVALLWAWLPLAVQCLAAEVELDPKVAAIFQNKCLTCHNGRNRQAGLSLETAEAALAGGESGAALVPGEEDVSLLVDYISGDEPMMPKIGGPLSASEVESIRNWIDRGAQWPAHQRLAVRFGWWSLRPVVRPAVPNIAGEDPSIARNPIDAFVQARLQKEGLTLSAAADRRILIRRLYFDLTGLPPPPADVDRFLSDPDPRAYEALVDRLLASPHYGERWARHWLDVAHYGDTMGFDKDKVRPHAWPYRDYVIRSFNEDKPYSRFVQEQLAGDVLYPGSADGLVALGFIAAGPFDWVGHIEVANGTMEKTRVRNLDRDDMVSSTMLTFTSTTAGCARCHDHKFDPISQQDYYGLQAVFAAVDRSDRLYDANPTVARNRAELNQRLRKLRAAKKQLESQPDAPADSHVAGTARELEKELTSVQSQLAALPEPSRVYAAATEFKGEGQFVATGGVPRPIYVLLRGNETSPDLELGPVAPCGLAALDHLAHHFDLPNDHTEGQRRVALAQWIVDPENPLTWRSIVNRVWQYHFGRGLVDSPNDFGRMGAEPTHPELLDWLAAEFRDGRQSIKDLHRLICNSATYRQASAHNERCSKLDEGNRLLWRMNRRKLEAEVIRDSVLAVSGKLDRRMGGPGFQAFGFKDDHSPHYQYDQYDPSNPDSHRRSIYRFIVRSVPDPFLTALDCADPSLSVGQRNETLTALQALALLNNRFMVRMSDDFAARVAERGDSITEQIEAAYRLALSRPPSDEEAQELVPIAERHGMANVCRLIFNLNEFLFVD